MEYIKLIARIPTPLLILIAAAGVIAGDYFGKFWSTNNRMVFYFLALLGYLISGIFYLPTLLKNGLVVTSLAWSLLSIIGFIFIGLFVFKETLTAIQIVGLIFGIISLIFLSF